MCVSWLLRVVVSRLGNGDCVCGPGVGADGWGRCYRAAAVEAECRVVCLPVWCGRYVEAVLCV